MIAPRASICVLLATSIVGLAGGALAAGKIRLAQTSNVTNCLMNCNSAYAFCQSSCSNLLDDWDQARQPGLLGGSPR
jgi:hypothetical protein